MPKSRLGVALLVPPPARGEVDGLRRALGDPALARIPAHLTLVPPVNVRDDALPEALAVLRAAAAATRPFRLALGPAATFLPVNPVAYLAVEGDLDALNGLRDRVFTGPLKRVLTWPFVPHVTIADEAAPERIEAAVKALADFRVEVVVERVHLLQEGEGPGWSPTPLAGSAAESGTLAAPRSPARVWTPIADAHFSAPAIVGRGGLPVELAVTEHLDADAAAFEQGEWADEPTGEERVPLAVTARRDGRVVGVAEGRVTSDGERASAHLSTLIVAPEERGTGVGAQLVAAFVSAAADHGAEQATVRTRNESFYRRLGWVEEARLSDGLVQFRRPLA